MGIADPSMSSKKKENEIVFFAATRTTKAFDGILTQATRAKSLPGTSRIAAIRKLMNRVPVDNKDWVSLASTLATCSF